MRQKWLLTGVMPVTMVIRKKSREEAARTFQSQFPEATLLEVAGDNAEFSTVDAICDACEEPIFNDEVNVGVNDCDLHERCVEEEEAR